MSKSIAVVTVVLSASLFACVYMQANNFEVINNTGLPVRILWRSNGLGPETRSGEFDLQPGDMCAACIQTYSENCVHILSVHTLDGNHRVKSKPFCNDSEIIISLKDVKSWKGSSIKKLDIEIRDIPVKAKL
jgi:hypothetical protein